MQRGVPQSLSLIYSQHMSWLNYLETLLSTPSVTGAESLLQKQIEQECTKLGLTSRHYLGLTQVEGTEPDSNYISIHIDRHGLVCTGPNEFQYAAFLAKYGHDNKIDSISKQTYNTLLERFIDQTVFAYDPSSGERYGDGKISSAIYLPERENVFFEIDDIGNVPTGCAIAYRQELKNSSSHISAQLDNILMVAVALELFKSGYQGTALFTCQEEAGRSWHYIREFFIRKKITPKNIIVLDTSPFPDQETADNQGIVLRNRDSSALFNAQLTEEIEKSCQDLNLNYSFKDEYIDQQNALNKHDTGETLSYGRTELGRLIQGTKGEISGTSIQIASTGYHTDSEKVNTQSVDNCVRLLKKQLT